MDAIRTSDGALVGLKRISRPTHPYEVEIGQFLRSEPLLSDPRNHTVPIYEILEVPDDQDLLLIVMPLYRRYDSSRFDTFGEVIAFLRQILEGLQFMHENLVAHRDCNECNIMMDASGMYPQSFHPGIPSRKPDYTAAKYYYIDYIDFDISRRYKPDEMPPDEGIIKGGDKTVPEFRGDVYSANPFPTDLYFLGNLMREDFLQVKFGFEFLEPLVANLVQDDRAKRYTADEALARFEEIVKKLSSWKLRSRVVKRSDSSFIGFFRTISHWRRRISFIVLRVPAIPMPQSQLS